MICFVSILKVHANRLVISHTPRLIISHTNRLFDNFPHKSSCKLHTDPTHITTPITWYHRPTPISTGTGVICTQKGGIPPHVLVSEYLGEIYPPYRWCERLDVIEQAQQRFGLKPALPDFYNILLERPRHVCLLSTSYISYPMSYPISYPISY